ncbi:hypothetical protein SAMN05443431_11149 [Olleya namhaensis]|uniref:Uncharacterized protein n=1 Tax=Olleya namhaensis TaxID=1144750 RepID=A0A1I3SPK1_9FLAO|nr:hypothetical protein SAMN05443431_11149 [Olleya namhaensis]
MSFKLLYKKTDNGIKTVFNGMKTVDNKLAGFKKSIVSYF